MHYNGHRESAYVLVDHCNLCMLRRKFHYLDFLVRTGIVRIKIEEILREISVIWRIVITIKEKI